ncbi:MAG: precorrin-3B C(17)-methyltransferase [Deltaproteobacteria bacterium]|nr:MAG: precorrin-3B C(17)-methyltransferase [Deltaproteobacteria bacterium]
MRGSSHIGSKRRKPDFAQTKNQKCDLSSGPGQLSIVGLGPGSADLLAPAAREAIKRSRVVVGYRRYIQLMDQKLLEGKEVISTGMKGEIERCQKAIEKALIGLNTVVVSSGDPGIYGMAGLVLELIEKDRLEGKVEIEVIPGIPAFAASAALLGAPLMHDFSVVSLSDLLTPWELIKKRIKAALHADFVLVIYNPKSTVRNWQLKEVLKEVESIRGGSVPVGIVRNATRKGQKVTIVKARHVDPDSVDMLTVLIIGNSQTRMVGNKMLTPRGYMERFSSRSQPTL